MGGYEWKPSKKIPSIICRIIINNTPFPFFILSLSSSSAVAVHCVAFPFFERLCCVFAFLEQRTRLVTRARAPSLLQRGYEFTRVGWEGRGRHSGTCYHAVVARCCHHTTRTVEETESMYEGHTCDLLNKKCKIHILLTNNNTCEWEDTPVLLSRILEETNKWWWDALYSYTRWVIKSH